MARMFGTDGVRGVANIGSMSPEMVFALGRAAVRVVVSPTSTSKPCFVIGRDTRLSGSMLEAALTAGICSAGADVLKVGILPTAGVAYLTRALGAVAGAMISASHNPYMDNGVKFFSAQGIKLDDCLEDEIEEQMRDVSGGGDWPTGKAIGETRCCEEPRRRYIEFLTSTYHHEKPISVRIGLDCANGAASEVAPALFTQLGAQVHVWHAAPDGININDQCGALHPEFLQQKVLTEGLDLGFAFDGDADRLIAIDQTGRILDGDYILAICAKTLLSPDDPSHRIVVSTIMANLGLDRALQQIGIKLHKSQVGDKYVVQALHQQGAVLGGEQSGHIVFLQYHTTGDGLLTAIQLLNALMSQRTSLADLAQTFRKFPQVLVNVTLASRVDPMTVPSVQKAVRCVERVLGNEGRVLVRLSGTELVARVMVEGMDEALITSLAQHIAQAIAQEIGSSSFSTR